MICCFLGSQDVSSSIGVKIIPLIESLISKGVYDFEVGNKTEFDRIVLYSLKKMGEKYPDISYNIALLKYAGEEDGAAFSSSLKIKDMIDRADIVVSYYGRAFYDTERIFEYAKSKHKRVIDLDKI